MSFGLGLTKAMYRQVAELHVAALDQSFLSTLGVPFLSLMYEAIDKSESCFLIVRTEGSEVVGFVAGSVSVGGVFREMFRSKLRLIASLLPSLLSVTRMVRIGENFLYARREVKAADTGLPSAELLTIGVKESFRGRHVADQLFCELSQVFSNKGIEKFKIIVGESLAPAHRFYRRIGALPESEIFLHGTARSIVYIYNCSDCGKREGF